MTEHPSKAWFAPKRYGYGSGLPVTWQGWLVLLTFIGVVLLVQIALTGIALILCTGLAIGILCIICALKTEGGWRWRWGDRS
ncbi:hypothetical protein [Sphingobium sp. EM0848]|uniref:hypothetical protein n=1 Tax=Sphingobium sp. EM0848 TaxID=2743473 RepID=UPI00159C72EA|nr:hypothetical protein [Sphingobium sp. EM0848]